MLFRTKQNRFHLHRPSSDRMSSSNLLVSGNSLHFCWWDSFSRLLSWWGFFLKLLKNFPNFLLKTSILIRFLLKTIQKFKKTFSNSSVNFLLKIVLLFWCWWNILLKTPPFMRFLLFEMISSTKLFYWRDFILKTFYFMMLDKW